MARASIGLQEYAAHASVPGCYGKVPALGDFFSRRLPQEFVGAWDAWLQGALEGSRIDLGERWEDGYFTAPIWRFALASHVCGENGWAGVLMPSVDKVGRAFPLTVAAAVSEPAQIAQALFGPQHWYARIEEIALSALSMEAHVEALDQALHESPFSNGAADNDASTRLPSLRANLHMRPLAIARLDDLPGALQVAAVEAFVGANGWNTFWWTRGREGGSADAFALAGLPDAETFAQMLCVG